MGADSSKAESETPDNDISGSYQRDQHEVGGGYQSDCTASMEKEVDAKGNKKSKEKKGSIRGSKRKLREEKKEGEKNSKTAGGKGLQEGAEGPVGAEAPKEDTRKSRKESKKEKKKDKKKSKKAGGKSLQEETEGHVGAEPLPVNNDDEVKQKQQQINNDEMLSLRTTIHIREQELMALNDHCQKLGEVQGKTTAELEAAKEEIAVKVAQVKQYQKQVEAYKQAQLKNEFEQLYNEEKQKNARLMEGIDKLKNKNDFEQLYHQQRQENSRLTDEIDQLKTHLGHLTEALSTRRQEERSNSNVYTSSQSPQRHRGSSASKASTQPARAHISHDSDDDLPPPLKLPKANHPPNTVSHLPQSSRPIAYPVQASQHHRVEADGMKSSVNIPFDPNLVCLICRRMFRKGEIQLFRQHVELCQAGDIAGDIV